MWIVASIFAVCIAFVAFSVRLQRRRNKSVRHSIAERGGSFLAFELLPRKWRGRRDHRRFAARYESKPGVLHFLIGEHHRHGLNVLGELTLQEWLSLEEEEGRAFMFEDMNLSRSIFDHPGKRYVNLRLVRFFEQGDSLLRITPDTMHDPTADEPTSLSFEGMLQGFRLLADADDRQTTGALELVVGDQPLDIVWRCDANVPPTWLEIERELSTDRSTHE